MSIEPAQVVVSDYRRRSTRLSARRLASLVAGGRRASRARGQPR